MQYQNMLKMSFNLTSKSRFLFLKTVVADIFRSPQQSINHNLKLFQSTIQSIYLKPLLDFESIQLIIQQNPINHNWDATSSNQGNGFQDCFEVTPIGFSNQTASKYKVQHFNSSPYSGKLVKIPNLCQTVFSKYTNSYFTPLSV